MPTLLIEKEKIEYKLKKRRTKDFSIRIEGGSLEVIVPRRVSQEEIAKYLAEHSNWISKRIHGQSTYILGGHIVYLGTSHMLETVIGNIQTQGLSFIDERFILYTNEENGFVLNKVIDEWLMGKTETIIKEKIERFKKIIGVEPKEIYVEKLFLRWASCSNFGNMKFHLRCAMLPENIIDYIVVHELSHLIQLNHSKNFWKEVKRVLPEYEQCQLWLDEEGGKYFQ